MTTSSSESQPEIAEFAFLVSDDEALLLTADKRGNGFLMTTRAFLQEAKERGWTCEEPEDVMRSAAIVASTRRPEPLGGDIAAA